MPLVANALALRSAMACDNYVAFFRSHRAAAPLAKVVIGGAVDRMRILALTLTLAAYRPSVPVAWSAQALGFGGGDELAACCAFLRAHGCALAAPPAETGSHAVTAPPSAKARAAANGGGGGGSTRGGGRADGGHAALQDLQIDVRASLSGFAAWQDKHHSALAVAASSGRCDDPEEAPQRPKRPVVDIGNLSSEDFWAAMAARGEAWSKAEKTDKKASSKKDVKKSKKHKSSAH